MRFNDVPNCPSDYQTGMLQYDRFIWTNFQFIPLSNSRITKCQNAFEPSQKLVACAAEPRSVYSGATREISVYGIDKGYTFNIESINALVITVDNTCGTVIFEGMKNNENCFRREVQINDQLQLITLNWTNIDKFKVQVYGPYDPFIVISQITFSLS